LLPDAAADSAEGFLWQFPGVKKYFNKDRDFGPLKSEATIKEILADYIYDAAEKEVREHPELAATETEQSLRSR
jgi:hypothetical protein